MKLTLVALGCIILLFGGVFLAQNTQNKEFGSEGVSSTVLDLSFKNLTKVPNDVFNNTNLEELDVSHNQLSGSLQAEVRHLSKLKVRLYRRTLMSYHI